MGDPLRAFELANVVVHLAEAQIDDGPPPRRDVRRARVNQVAVKHQNRARGPGRRDDAALIGQAGHCLPVEGPERVAGRFEIMPGLQHAAAVTSRYQHQRTVDVGHVVVIEEEVVGTAAAAVVNQSNDDGLVSQMIY